jgi:hypothetical protein
MWAGSLGLIASFILILGLAIALSVIIAVPILAVPFFIVGFAIFLIVRGARRTEETLHGRSGSQIPTTEEAAADPVADSSVPDVARSQTDAQTR